METGVIIIGVLVVAALLLVAQYNGLVAARNRTNEAYSDIDVQLKRRYDLIPNLIESVKGYAQHEQQLFENVTQARANAIATGDKGLAEHAQAENQLTQALRSIFAVAENYPDLKASQNFQQLSTELTDTENKLEAARRFYNGNVRDLNTKIETFPTNIFAGLFGFAKREFFDVDDAQKEAPKVSFS
jgi:LemA protein